MTRRQEDEELIAEIINSAELHRKLTLQRGGSVVDVPGCQMCALGAWVLAAFKPKDVKASGIRNLGAESALTVLTMRGYPASFVAGVNDGFENNPGAIGGCGFVFELNDSEYKRGWAVGAAVAEYAGVTCASE